MTNPYNENDIDALLRDAVEGIHMEPRFKTALRERIRQAAREEAAPTPQPQRPPVTPHRARRRSHQTPLGQLAQSAAVLVFVMLIGVVAWQAATTTDGPRYFVPIDGEQLSAYQKAPERAQVNGQLLWRNLTLEEARTAVDFTIIEPQLGTDWRYAGATVSEQGQAVTLTYRRAPGTKLHITQEYLPLFAAGGSKVPIGQDMTVSEYTIAGERGEYVTGSWNSVLASDIRQQLDLNDRQDVWEPDPSYRTLRWQVGRYLFTLQLFGNIAPSQPAGANTTDNQLIEFAEGLNLTP